MRNRGGLDVTQDSNELELLYIYIYNVLGYNDDAQENFEHASKFLSDMEAWNPKKVIKILSLI